MAPSYKEMQYIYTPEYTRYVTVTLTTSLFSAWTVPESGTNNLMITLIPARIHGTSYFEPPGQWGNKDTQ